MIKLWTNEWNICTSDYGTLQSYTAYFITCDNPQQAVASMLSFEVSNDDYLTYLDFYEIDVHAVC